MKRFDITLQETLIFKGLELNKAYAEPKYTIEICTDADNSDLLSSWYIHNQKVYNYEGKLLNEVISKFGLKKCKKSESTHIFLIGLKNEYGTYTIGNFKQIWCIEI